jgi:hypothetical protein
LPSQQFEEQLVALLHISAAEARMLFTYLDFHQDNVLAIDDVLDAFTAMQAAWLPNYRPPEREAVDLEQHRMQGEAEMNARQVDRADDEAVNTRSRSVVSSSSTSSRPRSSMLSALGRRSSMSGATISPTDVKATQQRGCSAASGGATIYNISTALPDSDSEHSEETQDAAAFRPRPWTSMAVSQEHRKGQRTSASGSGATRPVIAPKSFTAQASGAFQCLPHLDLAAAHRRNIEVPETPKTVDNIVWAAVNERLEHKTLHRGEERRRSGDTARAAPGRNTPEPHQKAHHAELPMLATVMSVHGAAPLPKRDSKTQAPPSRSGSMQGGTRTSSHLAGGNLPHDGRHMPEIQAHGCFK